MKINGYAMNWEVFVEGEVSGIDEFNSNRETDSFLISGTRKEADGKESTWAAYWDKDENSLSRYSAGTTACYEECAVLEFTICTLFKKLAEKIGYDPDSTDSVRAFLSAAVDLLNSDAEYKGITTSTAYVVETGMPGRDVFTDVFTDRETAVRFLYDLSDLKREVSVTEVTAIDVNDLHLADRLGYDDSDEMIADILNLEEEDLVRNFSIVNDHKNSCPNGFPFYYIEFYNHPQYSESLGYTSGADRDLLRNARETLKYAEQELEFEGRDEESFMCCEASPIDITSGEDLKKMLSNFPTIEAALREIDRDDIADDLEHLDLQIVRAFDLD